MFDRAVVIFLFEVGLYKTEASRDTLQKINPDVNFEVHTSNICTVTNFEVFLDRLKNGGKTEGTRGANEEGKTKKRIGLTFFFQWIWFLVASTTLKLEPQSIKLVWSSV